MGLNILGEAVKHYLPVDYCSVLERSNIEHDIVVPFFRNQQGCLIAENISKLTNMLVIGTTGTGKTAFIQSLLTLITVNVSPTRVKLIIFDSTGIEYLCFNEMPHMLTPVITDTNKINDTFSWVESEIGRRLSKRTQEPEIIFVLDDYAMSYLDGSNQMITMLNRGCQVGIHFWLSTSIPSTKTVSDEMKNSIPFKVVFHVTSRSLSKMILEDEGAEHLPVPGGIKYKAYSKVVPGKAIYIDTNNLETILGIIKKIAANTTISGSQHINTSSRSLSSDSGFKSPIAHNAGEIVSERSEIGREKSTCSAVAIADGDMETLTTEAEQAVLKDVANDNGATIDRLGEIAVEAFSQSVECLSPDVTFTPRPKINGIDAGLEITEHHIEISKMWKWPQIATYSFKPKRIKRIIYHDATPFDNGFVKFELDSFEWNVSDNRTGEEKSFTKVLPEQAFVIKFDRKTSNEFKEYARQIATEAELMFVIEK